MNIEHQQHFHSSLPLPIRHQYVKLYLSNVEAVLKTFCDGFSEESLAGGEIDGEEDTRGNREHYCREHVSEKQVRR